MFRRKTMDDVLGQSDPLEVVADRTTRFDSEQNAFIINAYDSIQTHECSAMNGGRVGMPAKFKRGGGSVTLQMSQCPFCGQSV